MALFQHYKNHSDRLGHRKNVLGAISNVSIESRKKAVVSAVKIINAPISKQNLYYIIRKFSQLDEGEEIVNLISSLVSVARPSNQDMDSITGILGTLSELASEDRENITNLTVSTVKFINYKGFQTIWNFVFGGKKTGNFKRCKHQFYINIRTTIFFDYVVQLFLSKSRKRAYVR